MACARSVIALSVIVSTTLAAQTPQSPARTFDVASVRRVVPGATPSLPIVGVGNGRLTASSVTLRDLIQAAYALEQAQIVGGPGWIGSDRFAVNAVVPADTSIAAVREMLQKLLVERFRLEARRESRELAAYVVESAGRTGPGLRRAGAECAPLVAPAGFDVSYPVDPAPTPSAAGAIVTDAAALAAAMREQLGLRLDFRRIPADVLVISRADPPSEN